MYLPSLFLLYFFLLSVAFLELLSDLELVFPSCLRLKQEEWIPGMVLQGFGSYKDIIIETQTPKEEQPIVKLPGIQWIPPESYENGDNIRDLDDWNPPKEIPIVWCGINMTPHHKSVVGHHTTPQHSTLRLI